MAIKDVLLESSDEKRENIIYIGDTYDTDVVGANAVGPNVDMVPRVVEIVSNNTNSSSTAGCQYFLEEDRLTILRCTSILEVDKFVFANVK